MTPKSKSHDIFPLEFQTGLHDCGIACLKMIAYYFEKTNNLQRIEDKLSITEKGISLITLREAADEIGLKTLAVKCTLEYLINYISLPAIAFLRDNHYVIIYRIDNNGIFIGDPAIGQIHYTLEQFEKIWYENNNTQGILIAIESA